MNQTILKTQICSTCVMDSSAPDITFDAAGQCHFCRDFAAKLSVSSGAVGPDADQLITTIKASGRGKPYDCIIGLSGGVDSAYVLYTAVRNGLRPLAVHLDNGWNSELATHNIANLVRRLNVDLHTHVIDWEENRDMQLAFFKANVVDIELLMDNAMLALNYQQAGRYGLRYILAGTNRATEGMRMPAGWNHLKFDATNIRAIQRRFGTMPIKTHPLISVKGFVFNEFVRRIKWTPFLDYFNYRKDEALKLLADEVGYRPYPYKHYESVFTRFYQGYILPRKFGIDKRRLHLSTLIISGQMSRDVALAQLEQSTYPDPNQLRDDTAFVLKKLGFSEESFNAYLSAPRVEHEVYGSEKWLWDGLLKIYRTVRGA